jgi:hypothetical protein
VAQKPICIITPTGMKCISSPIKDHHPGDEPCRPARPNADRDAKVAELRRFLKLKRLDLPRGRQDVIAKVAELLLAANVGGETPFAIIRAG